MDYCIVCEAWVRPTEEDDCPYCDWVLTVYCAGCEEPFCPDEVDKYGFCALCGDPWDSLTC